MPGHAAGQRWWGQLLSPPVEAYLERLRKHTDQLVRMTEAEWSMFAACMKLARVEKKGFLLQPGEVCRHVSFIGQGASAPSI